MSLFRNSPDFSVFCITGATWLTEIVVLRSLRWCNDLGRREISWLNFHGFLRAHRGVELSTLCRVLEAVTGQGASAVTGFVLPPAESELRPT